MCNRGRKLSRKARPVSGSLRRDVACSKFIEQEKEEPETGICILVFCIIEIDISNAASVRIIRHALHLHFRDVIEPCAVFGPSLVD